MTAGAWATMEEECLEVLHSVEEALAEEMRQETQQVMCSAPSAPPDGARIAACLHLQRAAMRSVLMQRERAAWKPPLRRPGFLGLTRTQKLELQ
jgi:hypothetical protein